MAGKTTEAQKKASKKYLEGKDEIRIRVDMGCKDFYAIVAKHRGKSMNQYIVDLIEKDIHENGV